MGRAARKPPGKPPPAGGPLDAYRAKRDPERTPEPFGQVGAPPAGHGAHLFIVQQHAARRLHWDFRLEMDGVLASWAIPRGPSPDPQDKRLAIQTEDHPLSYADFEGVIPPGNYGAGSVILWDRGSYQTVDGLDPAEARRRGKLDLELTGHKLRGRWALVRTTGGTGNQWLLFHKATGASGPDLVAAYPGSVLSGLTVEEVGRGVRYDADLAAAAAAAGAAQRRVDARRLTPMLAATADEPFSRTGWLFELKHDGVRALAVRQGPEVRLYSRAHRDLSTVFPEITLALGKLPCDAFVLDGEIVTLDEQGASSFERLQGRLGRADPRAVARAAIELPVLFYAFDALALAGYDLRALPLIARKTLLQRLLPRPGIVRFCDHIEREGTELFAAATERGLEGVIAKRADAPYQSGRRSRDWLKIKAERSADLAIVGFVPGKGARRALGSLMLAWARDGELVYAGNAGSGLGTEHIDALLPQLEAARRRTPAFRDPAGVVPREARFVTPQLVAEVRYREVTMQGLLRHPVFLRWRADKSPAECRAAEGPPLAAIAAAPAAAEPALETTHRDKVFWPAEGYTKGALLDYYEAVWPRIAPYLRDRPVVLTRYPDGIGGKHFFQKNAPPFTPAWVSTHRIGDTDYFICNDLRTLLYVINLGCIPLHVWSARTGSLDRPDWAILDLDPKGAPFTDVVTVARHIHRLLTRLDAPHFVKTSGQDGLHVLIPLGATLGHAEARTFAEVLARVVAVELPQIATVARSLGGRGGKVYVDYLQNGFGKTIAGPFSVRPRSGAPVSTPLRWSEVTARLDPMRFTLRTVPRRSARNRDPMLAVLTERLDVGAMLDALQARLRDVGLSSMRRFW
jgi:bifunctional non-homologous end joining protein LigD